MTDDFGAIAGAELKIEAHGDFRLLAPCLLAAL